MKIWWAFSAIALAQENTENSQDEAGSRKGAPDRGMWNQDRLIEMTSSMIMSGGKKKRGGKCKNGGCKGSKGKQTAPKAPAQKPSTTRAPAKAPTAAQQPPKRGGKCKNGGCKGGKGKKTTTTAETTTTTTTTTTTKTTTEATTTRAPPKKEAPRDQIKGTNQSNNQQAAYNYVGTAGQTQDIVDGGVPQFFLPGSLTPTDVTKWGSGCSLHCLHGFSGRCQLCGSAACRVAPHEFECRQYKHCTLNVNNVCKPGEDCDAVRTRWWQTCWTSPCTSRCWYKGSVGNQEACDECCDMACREDDKYIGNSCFRCALCKERWGPHTWGKVSPEVKYNGHVCWGRDKTKGVIMDKLKYDLPEDSNKVIAGTLGQAGSFSNSKPNGYKPGSSSNNAGDVGISTSGVGSFELTKTPPKKLVQDKNRDCQKICLDAKKSTTRGEPAHVQAKEWNMCKECYCWENPQMEMCEAIDCHVACLSSNMSGEGCLTCTRCKTCPAVANKDKNDNFVNAVQSIFSRDQAGSAPIDENEAPLLLGERSAEQNRTALERTVNSQFGYIHAASQDATRAIQELGILNVFKPKCMSCNRMDDRQSCRESCAAYKRNPQNHIAAHNCKQGNCAVVLASACKNCIRNCDNIKSVSLSAAGKANPDVGDTSFENCYHTFGCASDCKAALKKVKGDLSSRTSSEDALTSIDDLSLEDAIQWALTLPFDSKKEAKDKGFFVDGTLSYSEELQAKSSVNRGFSVYEMKKKGWWWRE